MADVVALAADLRKATVTTAAEPVVLDTTEATAKVVLQLLQAKAPIAVDFEGVDLCRRGELCLVQMSNGTTTWLVDITTLGQAAFEEEGGKLRELLESKDVLKVGYDGRADADALRHLHQTGLAPLYDVQIASCKRQDADQGRRDPFVHGLGKSMGRFLDGDTQRAAELHRIKTKGLKLFAPEHGGSYEVWKERPLKPDLIKYAAADVALLLEMKTAWETCSPESINVAMAERRLAKAVGGASAAKGKSMARKDF